MVSNAFFGLALMLLFDIIGGVLMGPGPHDAVFWIMLFATFGTATCWAAIIAVRTRRGRSLAGAFWLLGIASFLVILGAMLSPMSLAELQAMPVALRILRATSGYYIALIWIPLIACSIAEGKRRLEE